MAEQTKSPPPKLGQKKSQGPPPTQTKEADQEEVSDESDAPQQPQGGRKPQNNALSAPKPQPKGHEDSLMTQNQALLQQLQVLQAQTANPAPGGQRIAPVRQSRIVDRPPKDEKDSSLKIKIELDLEVEVDLYARVKGDVTIGLM